MQWPDRIWVIGCGNMGGAIVQAWLDSGLPAENITIIKPNQTALPGGLVSQTDYPAGPLPDIILLAMKPYHLDDVAEKLAPYLDGTSQIISVLAGTEIDVLRAKFPRAAQITRLMPNMAVTVGKSPMIFVGERDDSKTREQMAGLFGALGPVEWLQDEAHMHIAIALSGSGPAFLFRFIDALIKGAADLGMEQQQAARLAIAMTDGAATLAARSDVDPGTLASQVAGKGGTTRKGLDVLDADGRINALMRDVLEAAMKRNMEMAEEAKG